MKINDTNKLFYNKMPVTEFKEHVKHAGLSNCNDLLAIKSYISGDVLEIGGGYGRVISWLLKNTKNKITTVEKSKKCLLLKRKFPNINIYSDITKLKHKYKTILWMMSGIMDFSKTEQQEMILILSSILTKNGIIAIDLPKAIRFKKYKQFYTLESEYGTLKGYYPSKSELIKYLTKSKLKINKTIKYKTATTKTRIIYLICKK